MEKRFPKNVRQIGNVSDTPKIYVEDYVDTFLNQLCDKTGEEPIGAFLIGERTRSEDLECVYISGAVCMEEVEKVGPDIAISDKAWDQARKDCKEYFDNQEIVGWFICLPGHPLLLNSNLRKLHEQHFSEKNSVLIMKDAEEKDELYFVYKYKELMQMGGHYIYYEKNAAMQNYMISVRKKIGVTPSETVEDKAAKDFRNIVRERFEVKEQRKNSRFMYASSVLLVLVVLIMGVTTMNNYDKMRHVQSTLDAMKESTSGSETKAQKTSGEVKADTEDAEQTENKKAADLGEGDAAQSNSQNNSQNNLQNSFQSNSQGNTAVSTMEEMSEDIYVVEKGDTLATISKKVYGDISHVDAICRMNGLSDGNLIFIGQKLLLP